MLKDLEKGAAGDGLPLEVVLAGLPCNADGLLPAIARQHDTSEVRGDRVEVAAEPLVDPETLYGK